jgi:leader peptidase (prepilin peptidase)/N-methyltransferase
MLPLQTTTTGAASAAAVGVILAIAALVDAHEHRLPNQLLAAALMVVGVGVIMSRAATVLRNSFIGMAVAGGLMLMVRLSRGVGMGDVKMAGVVGASVGASTSTLFAAPIAIALAAFAAAVFGLFANRRRLALGPSLWFGWAAALALATALPLQGWSS